MAITIKELLAADTISQAADKINFNFDQLLLNGGGPVGPIGPLGPPGPIGGRGIRGSIWYEGEDNPNSIIFPSLETGDQYLRGPISSGETGDGDVFEYTGSNWVYTGINIKGDTGDSGTSEWTFYQDGADANFIYPSVDPLFFNDVKAAVIGGVPTTVPFAGPAEYVMASGIQDKMDSDFASLLIHVPDDSIESIVFSGGDAALNYTTDWAQLTRIGLKDGDRLQIQDARNVGGLNDVGINFISEYRNIEFDVCRTFQVQTGMIGSGAGLTQPADIYLRVTNVSPTGATGPGVIRLHNQGGNDADFKVGAPYGTSGFAGSPTGNIWGEGVDVDLNANKRVKLNSAGGTVDAIYLDATSGGITIDSLTGTQMTNNTFSLNSTTFINVVSDVVMNYTSTDNATFQSLAGKVLINAPAADPFGAIILTSGGKIELDATHNIELESEQNVEIHAEVALSLDGDDAIIMTSLNGYLSATIDDSINIVSGSTFQMQSSSSYIGLSTDDRVQLMTPITLINYWEVLGGGPGTSTLNISDLLPFPKVPGVGYANLALGSNYNGPNSSPPNTPGNLHGSIWAEGGFKFGESLLAPNEPPSPVFGGYIAPPYADGDPDLYRCPLGLKNDRYSGLNPNYLSYGALNEPDFHNNWTAGHYTTVQGNSASNTFGIYVTGHDAAGGSQVGLTNSYTGPCKAYYAMINPDNAGYNHGLYIEGTGSTPTGWNNTLKHYLETHQGGLMIFDNSPIQFQTPQNNSGTTTSNATLHLKTLQQDATSTSGYGSGWDNGVEEWVTHLHMEGQTIYEGGQNFLGLSCTLDYIASPTAGGWQGFGSRIQQSIDSYWFGNYIQFGGYVNGFSNEGGMAFGAGNYDSDKYFHTAKMVLKADGKLGLGTNNFSYGGSTNVHYTGYPYTAYTTWVSGSATAKFSVGGSIGCTFISTSSDERLKENIVPINSSLERILNTRPVFYTWKDPQHGNFIHGGFIGQELQKSIPEAVRIMESDEFEDGKYTIHYDTVLATAVGAIQELKTENDELKERLKLIEEKLGL